MPFRTVHAAGLSPHFYIKFNVVILVTVRNRALRRSRARTIRLESAESADEPAKVARGTDHRSTYAISPIPSSVHSNYKTLLLTVGS